MKECYGEETQTLCRCFRAERAAEIYTKRKNEDRMTNKSNNSIANYDSLVHLHPFM